MAFIERQAISPVQSNRQKSCHYKRAVQNTIQMNRQIFLTVSRY